MKELDPERAICSHILLIYLTTFYSFFPLLPSPLALSLTHTSPVKHTHIIIVITEEVAY